MIKKYSEKELAELKERIKNLTEQMVELRKQRRALQLILTRQAAILTREYVAGIMRADRRGA